MEITTFRYSMQHSSAISSGSDENLELADIPFLERDKLKIILLFFCVTSGQVFNLGLGQMVTRTQWTKLLLLREKRELKKKFKFLYQNFLCQTLVKYNLKKLLLKFENWIASYSNLRKCMSIRSAKVKFSLTNIFGPQNKGSVISKINSAKNKRFFRSLLPLHAIFHHNFSTSL